MQSRSMTRFGGMTFVAASILTLAACGGGGSEKAEAPAPTGTETTAANTAAPAATGAAPAAMTVAADNTDALTGVKFADFKGDAAAGETAFVTCKTCHAVEGGVNKIGPSLAGIVGRNAGTIEGFRYSPNNKNSGIVWTPEKLFQYLEKPSRIVPGTYMAFAGIPEPQKRADVIAYLSAN